MNHTIKHIANRTLNALPAKQIIHKLLSKYALESFFWEQELENYVKWYKGEVTQLYGCNSPTDFEKINFTTDEFSAVATWVKLFQQKKYLNDLELTENCFTGLKVLDIGSGPFPSAQVFGAESLYCIDPLFYKYIKIGYPIHIYSNSYFVNSYSESMPFPNNSFDVILSVNSLDHVDSVEKTAREITRVLKPEGKLAIHAHFHESTFTEPLALNHNLLMKLFSNIKGFGKIKESSEKYGWKITETGEKYCLYKNF